MTYTQHYQLPQWVETDRILMEDFNDMTEKIDAAIFSRLGPAEVIQQLTITNDTDWGEVILDISDLDWSQWSFLMVEYRCTFNPHNTPEGSAILVLDTSSDGGSDSVTLISRNPAGPTLAILAPLRSGARPITSLGFPGGTLVTHADAFQTGYRFRVAATANFYPHITGTGALTLYGIH